MKAMIYGGTMVSCWYGDLSLCAEIIETFKKTNDKKLYYIYFLYLCAIMYHYHGMNIR